MVTHLKRPAIGNTAQIGDFILGHGLFGHRQTHMFTIAARTPAFDKADFQIIAPGKRTKRRCRAAQEAGKSLIILHRTTRLWNQFANLLKSHALADHYINGFLRQFFTKATLVIFRQNRTFDFIATVKERYAEGIGNVAKNLGVFCKRDHGTRTHDG